MGDALISNKAMRARENAACIFPMPQRRGQLKAVEKIFIRKSWTAEWFIRTAKTRS
jgi:hypothetical protein